MYADDIILLADTPADLQTMINELSAYCKQWDLTVNTSKSKVMTFKKHPRRYKSNERWHYNEEPLEIVKHYKYLGVWITPNVSFNFHLEQKLADSKRALNSTWKTLLSKQNVPHSTKYKLFQATSRAIMYYAAQIWGVSQQNEVEKLLKFFLKKLFRLPLCAPDYMIHLETGLPTLHQYTLAIHFDYMNKVMAMPNFRLPKKVAEYLLSQNLGFSSDWESLAYEHGEPITISDITNWKSWQDKILIKIQDSNREKWVADAYLSKSRELYKLLNFDIGANNYFNDKYSVQTISSIFKLRGEIMALEYQPHVRVSNTECSLCNMRQRGDVRHFLTECPILSEIRRLHFGVSTLSSDQLVHMLNGENWLVLANYTKDAFKYRLRIINEEF